MQLHLHSIKFLNIIYRKHLSDYFLWVSLIGEQEVGFFMQLGNLICYPEDIVLFSKKREGVLMPAEVPEEQFWLLIEISSIHSERIIQALKDYLVSGYSRKAVCERYGVNNGYFSTSLGRLHRINQMVWRLAPYYRNVV